jgi:hypothetical protein
VQYGLASGDAMMELKAEAVPSDRKWSNFRKRLDAIGIWQWRSNYDNPYVLDGVQWNLEIDYGSRKVQTDGSNWYPGSSDTAIIDETPEFKAFLQALSLLLGGVKIG